MIYIIVTIYIIGLIIFPIYIGHEERKNDIKTRDKIPTEFLFFITIFWPIFLLSVFIINLVSIIYWPIGKTVEYLRNLWE